MNDLIQSFRIAVFAKTIVDLKTAKCYYAHWKKKVFNLSKIVYPNEKEWMIWLIYYSKFSDFLIIDVIPTRAIAQYKFETEMLIKEYHLLKFYNKLITCSIRSTSSTS